MIVLHSTELLAAKTWNLHNLVELKRLIILHRKIKKKIITKTITIHDVFNNNIHKNLISNNFR